MSRKPRVVVPALSRTSKRPTPNSKITNGCSVRVISKRLKGTTGIAWMFVTSMWTIKLDGGGTATMHRKQLKRVVDAVEGRIAA